MPPRTQKQAAEGDRLYLIAERLAQEFSLFPSIDREDALPGLLRRATIARRAQRLQSLDIDSYIEAVVAPAEDKSRTPAPEVIRQLGKVQSEVSKGPFYTATLEMDFDGDARLIGFIAQDRSVENGAWGPAHHLDAARFLEGSAKQRLPIVTFMDTPGADAREEANRNNQAHSISRLITESSNVDVPNVGVIYGLGYSGGAIPLAASNMVLSVADGVFSTIQPPSLANIARRLDLSWQECAKYVGLSPFELFMQGNIDGVIDYSPSEPAKLPNLRSAIVAGLRSVEERAKQFVAQNPYIIDHYQQSLQRYLNPPPQLRKMLDGAALTLTKSPTEYQNVFGIAFRYLRYLKVRQRIKATSTQQYGRLADRDLPKGELAQRADRERRRTFLKWMQDPDKVVYDDGLSKAWRNYNEKKQALQDERGRLATMFLGEPRRNYQRARANLISTVGAYLYNRWKGEAAGNLGGLRELLTDHEDTRYILRVAEVRNPVGLIRAIRRDREFLSAAREHFSHEGKKLLRAGGTVNKSETYLSAQLTAELNLLLTGGALGDGEDLLGRVGRSRIRAKREALEQRYGEFIDRAQPTASPVQLSELTLLDVLIADDLRQDFLKECESLLLFDVAYDHIVTHLDSIAEEAQSAHLLSRSTVGQLLESSLAAGALTLDASDEATAGISNRLRAQVLDWYLRVLDLPKMKTPAFFRAVEEWKRARFPDLAEALFVVVTYLFEHLLESYVYSERTGKAYNGRIAPKSIGRRKDFWYRLNMAYQDLQMQSVLRRARATHRFTYQDIIDAFFTGWHERFGDLISSDPCAFPGFRHSIEAALNQDLPPCGVVTGTARFKAGEDELRCGLVLSNVAFQAGSFDMASAEKFCKLLVLCATRNLPVICFISSGGMQTKEGAGALFSMAAVNDRITRFVRDHGLPIIVFGYGDCTGGAQASFVTHPLVQTYYLSGASIPFAGQIVVPSNLPLNSILANYLSTNAESMQGLVEHPFLVELDNDLRRIDPDIPLPKESVDAVIRRVLSGVLDREAPEVVAPPRYTDADLIRPIKRLLIHARGCTAAKLVRVAQRHGLEVVLVQSDPDMESAVADQLSERDTLVCIGGNTPDESYLNARSVLSIAEQERTDALHPGIGFLSESAQFAELTRSRGLNFIGPPVPSMETMGNKSNAINTALRLGVPVVPGSHGILTDAERAAEVADEIGYPVLIKAVHGGGGKGIQVVESSAEFFELFHRVTAEAQSAFGNGDVYLEKCVTSLRHIEVQLLRDTLGNTLVLGLRDCSVQRDKQKVFEESGSTMLPEDLRRDVLTYSGAIADEVGYVGAGTVEFIFDLTAGAVYFMEMNTRLQVEHPVTEWVSGIDIVGEQFRIAAGESIAELEPKFEGYAIEARVNAERVQSDGEGALSFRPHPGTIEEARFPVAKDVDVITIAAPGKLISPYYDSMIAQVIVHAKDRPAAIKRLADYLGKVRITGICTNIPLLKRVLADEVFRDGDYDTGFLPEFLGRTDVEGLIEEIEAGAGEPASAFNLESIGIDGSDELKVLSPAAAIFYTSPSPSEPEFVSVGDRIAVDATLCQLEAMKIFTPLALKDFNGEASLYDPALQFEVTRINMGNGQQVSAGDLLFVVRPLKAA
ncbi:MAG: ATP-grasp domain-containing protein [Gammaproteobacteria bacterium]|nr:ATP-grasp domain-containing protein [Gammaproteobacteria bacterium]